MICRSVIIFYICNPIIWIWPSTYWAKSKFMGIKKLYNVFVAPFPITYFAIRDFITGKPDVLMFLSGKIEKCFDTKVVGIDLSTKLNEPLSPTQFNTNLRSKPSPVRIKAFEKELGIRKGDITFQDGTAGIAIVFSSDAMKLVQNHINKFPNVFQRSKSRIIK